MFSSEDGNAISIADFGTGTQPVQTTLSVTNGTLLLSGIAGLTFTAGGNGTASMTFTGTVADIDRALDGLSYTPNIGYTGRDTLSISRNDVGSDGSQTAFTIVNIVIPKFSSHASTPPSLPRRWSYCPACLFRSRGPIRSPSAASPSRVPRWWT